MWASLQLDDGVSIPTTDSASLGHSPGVPVVSVPVLGHGVVGALYDATFSATGYPDPTFSVSGGSLPDGLSLSASGELSGTPTTAGTYDFMVTAANAWGTDTTEQLELVIDPPGGGGGTNRPPSVTDLDVSTPAGVPVGVDLKGVDPDGDPLTFEVTSPPSHGTLSGTAPELTYTPASGFEGSDSFGYTASDGSAVSTVATVHLSVTTDKVTLGGTVTSSGVPTRGAQVRVYAVGGAVPVRHAVTLADGTWEITGLPPGRYEVQVVPPSRRFDRAWVGTSGGRDSTTTFDVAPGESSTGINANLTSRG
jgi:hypothetical protein